MVCRYKFGIIVDLSQSIALNGVRTPSLPSDLTQLSLTSLPLAQQIDPSPFLTSETPLPFGSSSCRCVSLLMPFWLIHNILTDHCQCHCIQISLAFLTAIYLSPRNVASKPYVLKVSPRKVFITWRLKLYTVSKGCTQTHSSYFGYYNYPIKV